MNPSNEAAADSNDSTGSSNRLSAWRDRIKSTKMGARMWRLTVGTIGVVVTVVGIILIPFPGPGWLIVFAGLGIMATEFVWAQRLLGFARRQVAAFAEWLKVQPLWFQGLFAFATFLLVVVILWLVGAVALVAGWFGIDEGWIHSPIPFLK